MAKSPLKKDTVIKYLLTVDGEKLTKIPIQSVFTENRVFKVATAKVNLLLLHEEGDNKWFELMDKQFKIGATIKIGLAYVNEAEKDVFEGIITRLQVNINEEGQKLLVLHCSSKAVKLTLGRNSAFLEGKDSAIISKLIKNHGLSPQVDATEYEHKSMIQYQAIDWDFIVARAEANGLIVYTDNDKVFVKKPKVDGSAKLKVSFGKDVFAFNGDIESRFQMDTVSATSWSPKTQKLVTTKAQKPSLNSQASKDEKGDSLAEVMGIKEYPFVSSSNLPKAEIKPWSDGGLLKYRLSRLHGSITFVGSDLAKINTSIELDGFGKRYNGEALITGVAHAVESGMWKTTVRYGLSPLYYHEIRNIHAPANGGLLPKIEGLHIGKVKQIHEDEGGEYRVLVDVPLIKESGTGIWARLTHLYATNKQGIFFYPEKGDEVILGFLNNDPRSAVILGSVYSSKQAPPLTPDEKNTKKAIITKSKLMIEFDDDKKDITIETPGKNKIIMSDDSEKITIVDSNKNSIEMSSSGITIKSDGNITLQSSKNINLKATKNIEGETSMGDVSFKGKNVSNDAKMSFSANGKLSSELKSTGKTTVKGTMVMIN